MSLKEILGNNPGNVEDYVKAFGSPGHVQHNVSETILANRYEFVPAEGFANTYALGVHKLRNECKLEDSHPTFVLDGNRVFRPLTFRE
ncbi:MAG: hypothetical protein ABIF40_03650, partial [archaeon]